MVWAPECGLDGEAYDLEPSSFFAHVIPGETDSAGEMLEIRVQQGSDLDNKSDGLWILVRDAKLVKEERLGVPITLDGTESALVRMNLYLNETCEPSRTETPVNYEARAGTITFRNLYAPSVSEREVEIAASFRDVELVDPAAPAARRAILSGDFRFLYNRGRPAQRFP